MLTRASAIGAAMLLAGTALAHAAPTVAAGYTLSTLTAAPSGDTGADSITAAGNNVFVGYGDHHAPTGLDGLSSTIVEYSMTGSVLGSTTVLGHNDGLRYDAATGQLWALQNEDSNPNLVLINPTTLAKSQAYSIPNPHGGGYDDVAFLGGKAYLTGSNPTVDANGNSLGTPALESVTIPASGSTLAITPILSGAAAAHDTNTGAATALNLTDPDGVTTTPGGAIQFTSQGDSKLITVHNPGTVSQSTDVLSLAAQVDDIAYAASGDGTLLFTDATTNALYALTGPFAPGSAYVAASFPDGSANAGTALGLLDPANGDITPLVSGVNPGGLLFVANAVPEPGTAAILGMGLLALLGVRRARARPSAA
jgi:hypothetical protein